MRSIGKYPCGATLPGGGGGIMRREQACKVYTSCLLRVSSWKSLEGIDVPSCSLSALQFLGEGLPEGVLPGLHFDVFPSTTIER